MEMLIMMVVVRSQVEIGTFRDVVKTSDFRSIMPDVKVEKLSTL